MISLYIHINHTRAGSPLVSSTSTPFLTTDSSSTWILFINFFASQPFKFAWPLPPSASISLSQARLSVPQTDPLFIPSLTISFKHFKLFGTIFH